MTGLGTQIVAIGSTLAFFVGIVIALGIVLVSSTSRTGVRQGLRAIDTVYGGARPQPAQVSETTPAAPLANRMARLGRVVSSGRSAGRLRRRLDLAGNPSYWTVERIYEIKGLAMIVAGLSGALLGFVVASAPGALLGGLVAAAAGFVTPDLVVHDMGTRRQLAVRKTLPDIIDTLTVSVEAGLSLEAGFAQIVRYGRGPLAGEFARVLQEVQIGRSKLDALRALGLRTSVLELRAFCAIVVQATELGVPIAAVLREQAKEMRVRRRQFAEEVAQKIPVKILFPLVFCLFPGIFIVILGPGLINILKVLQSM